VLNERGESGAKIFSQHTDIVTFVLGYFWFESPCRHIGRCCCCARSRPLVRQSFGSIILLLWRSLKVQSNNHSAQLLHYYARLMMAASLDVQPYYSG